MSMHTSICTHIWKQQEYCSWTLHTCIQANFKNVLCYYNFMILFNKFPRLCIYIVCRKKFINLKPGSPSSLDSVLTSQNDANPSLQFGSCFSVIILYYDIDNDLRSSASMKLSFIINYVLIRKKPFFVFFVTFKALNLTEQHIEYIRRHNTLYRFVECTNSFVGDKPIRSVGSCLCLILDKPLIMFCKMIQSRCRQCQFKNQLHCSHKTPFLCSIPSRV